MEIDQTYEVVRIDGDHDPLKEHPQNPNQSHDAAIDESVEENGWYGAVIAQKSTGYILAGHGRYRTAKSRSASEIPVIWKDVDDETAMRILLGDNQIARLALVDEEQLTMVLQNLESLKGTGFDTVLHPLEKQIEGERNDDNDALEQGLPRAGDDLGESAEPTGSDPPPVPDDVYTPEFGVIIVAGSEQQQAAIYERMLRLRDLDKAKEFQGVQIRVVAV
jgi:ParB-like chromosome segregation protein Spo0J